MTDSKKIEVAPHAPPGVGGDSGTKFRTARVHRSGNSYGFYVPKAFAVELGFDTYNECRVYIVGDVLCLQPVRRESFVPHVIGVRK